MSIIIKEVTNKKLTKAFMSFPIKLYKNEKNYVPPLLFDEMNSVNPKKNPVFDHCEIIMFLAYKDNKIVGRIRGLINHKYNKKENVKHLRFNHFDVIDDFEVTKALFDAIIKWGKKKGLTEINGPIGYTDIEKQGMLIDGYDQDGMFITYYNYPYYKEHMEKLKFVKDVDWIEYKIHIPNQINEKIERIALHLLNRNKFKLVKLTDKKDISKYLYKIFDLYNETFAPLHGVVELSKELIDYLVKQYKTILNLDYLSIVTDQEDNVLAFGLLAPSLSNTMRKIKGRLFPFGFITFFKALKTATVLDMYMVAVKPEYQGMGLNAILMWDATKQAIKHNVKIAETGPELEDNARITTFWKHYESELIRRRRCFIRKIDN